MKAVWKIPIPSDIVFRIMIGFSTISVFSITVSYWLISIFHKYGKSCTDVFFRFLYYNTVSDGFQPFSFLVEEPLIGMKHDIIAVCLPS